MPRYQQSLAIFAIVVVLAAFSYLAVRHNQAVGKASTGTDFSSDTEYVQLFSSTTVDQSTTSTP